MTQTWLLERVSRRVFRSLEGLDLPEATGNLSCGKPSSCRLHLLGKKKENNYVIIINWHLQNVVGQDEHKLCISNYCFLFVALSWRIDPILFFPAGFRASSPGRASKSCLFHKFPGQNQKGCPSCPGWSSESDTCMGTAKDQTKCCRMTWGNSSKLTVLKCGWMF